MIYYSFCGLQHLVNLSVSIVLENAIMLNKNIKCLVLARSWIQEINSHTAPTFMEFTV